MGATPPDICELGGIQAVNSFTQARESAERTTDDAYADPLVAIKATYNTGIAYRDTHNRNCYLYEDPDDPTLYLIPARQQFDQVEGLHEALPADVQALDEAKNLLTSALMERAQIERSAEERMDALDTLAQIIEIAAVPDDDLAAEQAWQQIRWKAHAVRSAIYVELAQLEDANAYDHWQSALAEAERLIWRLEQPGVYEDWRTIHNAYYFAGRAQEALGNTAGARAYYWASIEVGDPTFTYYAAAQDRLAALEDTA
jgi:hypothetical protein